MSGRRGRGEGSVHFDKDRGRWVGVIDLGSDPDTGKRRRRKVSAPTKTEARAALGQLADELRETGTVAPRDLAVSALMRDWTEHPPPDLKSPISLRVHQQYAARITAPLATVPAARLTVGQ